MIAILLDEPESIPFQSAMYDASDRLIGAPTWFETSLVLEGRTTAETFRRLDDVITRLNIMVVPFTAELAAIAREANRRYGGRPARLNFGDCMAYALAKHSGQPLLYKGNDFAHTDVTPALT